MKKTIAASVLIVPLVLSCNVYCRADSYSIGMNRAHAARLGNVARYKNTVFGIGSGAKAGATAVAWVAAKYGSALGGKVGAVLGGLPGTVLGMALGGLCGAAVGLFEDKEAIAAETAKSVADRDLKDQITSLMREQDMTQNAINTVYNELRNQQARSGEDILAAVNQALAKADATQEQITALSTKLCAKVEENQKQLLQATEDIKQGQQLMLGKVDAVKKRMDREFEILGADLENRHAAQMAALSANLQAIQGVDASVAKLSKDMFTEFARLGSQLSMINEKLDRIEAKLDRIEKKLDKSIKAHYMIGNRYLTSYYDAQKTADLLKAQEKFLYFLEAYAPAENEFEEGRILRGNTYASIIQCYLLLVASGEGNEGYMESAVTDFREMIDDNSVDISFINCAYLLFMRDEVSEEVLGQCSSLLMACYERRIADVIDKGDLNTAEALAGNLKILCGADNELSKATETYVRTGADPYRIFKSDDAAVLQSIIRYDKGEKGISTENLPQFARKIVEGKGEPTDYEALLQRFNYSSNLVIFSISKLFDAGYKDAAFKILKRYDTAHDDFRVKAYLAFYSERDGRKFADYKKLVLEDPTFSSAAKDYAKRL